VADDQVFNIESVTFVGEQDGDVERELKAEIVAEFTASPSVRRAYLALVRYGESPDVNVALCVFGPPEDVQLVDACAARFRAMFGPTEHLDTLFLDPQQDSEVARVCKPFFSR
jgi:hypothetical protein